MTQVFGLAYSELYDTFYQDKDYELECHLVESLLGAEGSALRVLDLGCGTGGHAQVLARRGHQVVGVDRSANMIAAARRKAESLHGSARLDYQVGDIRTARVDQEFDAVIMMFAVLGYQVEDADVLATLRTARRHLQPGGRLLCDFWYGPAVLHQRPTARTRDLVTSQGPIARTASARLDPARRTCTVDISWRGPGADDSRSEQHVVRYFFPTEIESWLNTSDFVLDRIGAWPETDRPADDTTWNGFLLAKAV